MVVDSGPEPAPSLASSRDTRGLRAGLIVLAGVVALNAGNYLFHVIAARRMGPSTYGDLATLITLSGLISLPLGGVQVWVARHVAQYRAVGDDDSVRWFTRRVSTYLIVIGVLGVTLFAALSWPLQQALGISSLLAVALTSLTVFPSVVTPMPWGLAQGLQRFSLVALAYGSGPVTRLVFLVIAFSLGVTVSGAMLATLASMLAALLLPLIALRRWFVQPNLLEHRLDRNDAIRSLLPVMIGLLAVTALTTDDVVVAKAALSSHEAGIYGSASLVGRVILYLPSAIITVLLPRVAARIVDRRETRDLLWRSIGATLAVCVTGTALYAVFGHIITRIAFGAKYAQAGGLLWLFGVAMTGYALLNVLLIYHLAREHTRMSWLLLGGAFVQICAFAVIHGSPRQLIAVDIVIAGLLLVAHELVIDRTLTRLLVGERA